MNIRKYFLPALIIFLISISFLSADKLSANAADMSITLYARNGTGDSKTVKGTSSGVKLPANEFVREGYVFRGWTSIKSSSACEYEDQATVKDLSVKNLYALWEPQLYVIRFDPNGADFGSMDDMYAIYDRKTMLSPLHFSKKGYRFAGWKDSDGNIYKDKAKILNLNNGNTYSRKIVTVDSGKPKNKDYTFRSTQGSVIYEENGRQYLVTAASINDKAYNSGDLSHYETVLTKFDVETGKAVKRVRNLEFDHGNSICYNEDNGHFYIAEGGTCKGYPSGVMEIDSDFKMVKEWNFPLLTHIWAIAYYDHHFYVIGRNNDSRNSFCVLNEQMQTLSITEVDQYYSDHFSSQGIAADQDFIYAVSAGFSSYEWKSKQRISVFTHDGKYVGVWTLDIGNEAEDITVLDGYAYITTNEYSKATLYKTKLPIITLSATWTTKSK